MVTKVNWRVSALALAVGALTADHAHAQLRSGSTESLTAADGSVFEVTSGFVRVPELRAAGGAPSGAVELAVVQVRRAGRAASTSAHVVLAGGPGDSGVNLVTGLARQGGAALSDLFDGDLVGIDQRGTGRSRPNLDTPALYGLPFDTPGTPEEWLPRMDRVSREVAAAFRAQGIRLEAYNTRESADDVADVRRALGYQKLTLWGRSYGSHLALATVARHPAIVQRLVLVSPEGPNHTWKLPSQVDAVIRRLGERGAADLEANMRQVLGRLAVQPATVSVRHPLSGAQSTVLLSAFEGQGLTAHALGDPRLIATLPAAYRQMAQGNFEGLAQAALLRRSRAGVQSAMKQVMDLSSGASVERRQEIDNESRAALLGNAINFPGMHLADAWAPTLDLGEDFRRPVRSTVPTLIVVGDLDPRTPLENAREIAETLPSAKLVVLENTTHQFDFFGSPAIRAVLAQFLRSEHIAIDRVTLPAIVFREWLPQGSMRDRP
jgi:pimeloyl-ACP methyl ester carboxylesterase